MRAATLRSGLTACLALVLGLPATAQLQMPPHCRPPVAPPPPAPAPAPVAPVVRSLFDTEWDWNGGARTLTFCIRNGTPALIANAVRAAATDLSNANFSWGPQGMVQTWRLQEVNPCPMGWNLQRPVMNQPRIRVSAEDLGEVRLRGRDADQATPYDEEDDEYRAAPDGSGGSRRPGGILTPPLAYFQPGPFLRGTREIAAGEIVFNWRVPMGMMTDPKWNTQVGTATFDPREVAMHEWGHAIRMRHDDHVFDDDRRICPEGSAPGANALLVERGPDNVLQTRIRPDDQPTAADDLHAGANGVANSGKKANVLETLAVLGRHTINPGLGFPANSDYSYTEREQATGQAAIRHRPRALGGAGGAGGVMLGGLPGQYQFWHQLVFFDGAGKPLPILASVSSGDGAEHDILLEGLPAAVELEATVDLWSKLTFTSTRVELRGKIGSPSGQALIHVALPVSPVHPNLVVEANAAGDTLTITDGSTAKVLCTTQLLGFLPGDCLDGAGAPFVDGGFASVWLAGKI